jgi:hypothetical protein
MTNNWKSTFLAFVKKEVWEIASSMKLIVILCIFVSNLLQYITIAEIEKLDLTIAQKAEGIGALLVYLVIIINLFLGHTLINRFVYEEKNNKTIQIMLASGMSKTAIWTAKMLVTILVCEIDSFLAIAVNYIMVYTLFGVSLTLTSTAAVLTFVTMPIFTFGILALISVGYNYFSNMGIFGMVFPLLAYLGIWNLSIQFATVLLPDILMLVSLLIGFFLIAVSMYLTKIMPNDKLIKRPE